MKGVRLSHPAPTLKVIIMKVNEIIEEDIPAVTIPYIVEPELDDANRKALSAYIKTLRKDRPTYCKVGTSFMYRGSKVSFVEPSKK